MTKKLGFAWLAAFAALEVAACGGNSTTGGSDGDSTNSDSAGSGSDSTSGTLDSSGNSSSGTDGAGAEGGDTGSGSDSASADSSGSSGSDSSGGASFTCGMATCTAPSQYCYEFSGGPPPPPDSGPFMSGTCKEVPAGCEPKPTCACIKAMGMVCVSSCTEKDGEVTVQCLAP